MNEYIITLGFIKSRLDPCIYYKREKRNERVMFLGLYVDDVMIAFHDEEELRDVTLKLEERFSIKMIGSVKKFFGITVHETQQSYFLSQQSIICHALCAFNLEHVRTFTTPMDPNTDYNGTDSEELVDLHRVREALGTLLWITNSTRPDITYATNFASRQRDKPGKCHWELIKSIFSISRSHRIVVCATGRQVRLFS